MSNGAFDHLLAANKRYARTAPRGFDGIAHEGVLILTCMDSRIMPLEMVGLRIGEAKILRTAGARITPMGLSAMVMGVHKLRVNKIMLIPHTKCAAASMTEEEMRASIEEISGVPVGDFFFGVDDEPIPHLIDDVAFLKQHPLIGPFAEIGGFLYDVDTGLLEQLA